MVTRGCLQLRSVLTQSHNSKWYMMSALLCFTIVCIRIQQFEIHKCSYATYDLCKLFLIHMVEVDWCRKPASIGLSWIHGHGCCIRIKLNLAFNTREAKHWGSWKSTSRLEQTGAVHIAATRMCTHCKCMNDAPWGRLVDRLRITGSKMSSHVCIMWGQPLSKRVLGSIPRPFWVDLTCFLRLTDP